MGFSAFLKDFAIPAGTGDQSVSGAEFTPKACIYFGNVCTADGFADHASFGMGLVGDSGDDIANSFFVEDNQATSPPSEPGHAVVQAQAGSVVDFIDDTGAQTGTAAFLSHDADGVTHNWSDVSGGVGRIQHALMLGGNDLVQAKVGTVEVPIDLGMHPFPIVGFRSDVVLFTGVSFNTGRDNFNSLVPQIVGWATGVGREGVAGSRLWAHRQSAGLCMFTGSPPVVTSTADAQLFALTPLGFNVNVVATGDAALEMHLTYLALRGINARAGSFNLRTTNGTQDITGLGFKPTCVLFLCCGSVTTVGELAHGNLSFGAAVSSSSRGTIWHGTVDSSNPLKANSSLSRTKCLETFDRSTDPATLTAGVDFTTPLDDGFRLNVNPAPAGALEVLYLALGPKPRVVIGGAAV
jgi:hypothetical protein